jgi:hypothetical protein
VVSVAANPRSAGRAQPLLPSLSRSRLPLDNCALELLSSALLRRGSLARRPAQTAETDQDRTSMVINRAAIPTTDGAASISFFSSSPPPCTAASVLAPSPPYPLLSPLDVRDHLPPPAPYTRTPSDQHISCCLSASCAVALLHNESPSPLLAPNCTLPPSGASGRTASEAIGVNWVLLWRGHRGLVEKSIGPLHAADQCCQRPAFEPRHRFQTKRG